MERRLSARRPRPPYRRRDDGRPGRRLLYRLRAHLGRLTLVPSIWLLAVAIVGAFPNGFFQTTRNGLFDSYQRVLAAERSDRAITIIDIDEESLHRIGQWPWPRTVLARLVDAAQAARAIGIDLILSEPDRLSPSVWAAERNDLPPAISHFLQQLPPTEATLSESLARAPVVLSAAVQPASRLSAVEPVSPSPMSPVRLRGPDPTRDFPASTALIPPLPVLAERAKGIGVVSVPSEFDGVLRRVPLVFNIGGIARPGFAAEVVRVAMHSGPVLVSADRGGVTSLSVGSIDIPTDRSGRFWPRYASRTPAVTIPAWRVLDGSADPALLAEHIVLIGATAAGLRDVIVTPLRQAAPGIDVHAQVISSILAGDGLWRPQATLALELLLVLVGGLAAQILTRTVRIIRYGLGFLGAAVALAALSLFLFSTRGLLLDWTMPLVGVAGTALLTLAGRVRREVVERRRREHELAQAMLTLEAADRAKTEFLANVSHELRTPLSAVIGFSEMMDQQIMGPLNPAYAGYARDINRSGRHLLSIIEDLLDLSVLELGGARRRDERVTPAIVLEDCVHMMTPRGDSREVRFIVQTPRDLPDLKADRRMIKQMILNLMSNAVKYAPVGSEVAIEVAMVGAWMRFTVRDRGPGIATNDLAKVTHRFGRLQSARLAQEPGLGIGLALTKSMIELHGGRLELESTLGQGTTALLWFPPGAVLPPGSSEFEEEA